MRLNDEVVAPSSYAPASATLSRPTACTKSSLLLENLKCFCTLQCNHTKDIIWYAGSSSKPYIMLLSIATFTAFLATLPCSEARNHVFKEGFARLQIQKCVGDAPVDSDAEYDYACCPENTHGRVDTEGLNYCCPSLDDCRAEITKTPKVSGLPSTRTRRPGTNRSDLVCQPRMESPDTWDIRPTTSLVLRSRVYRRGLYRTS